MEQEGGFLGGEKAQTQYPFTSVGSLFHSLPQVEMRADIDALLRPTWSKKKQFRVPESRFSYTGGWIWALSVALLLF